MKPPGARRDGIRARKARFRNLRGRGTRGGRAAVLPGRVVAVVLSCFFVCCRLLLPDASLRRRAQAWKCTSQLRVRDGDITSREKMHYTYAPDTDDKIPAPSEGVRLRHVHMRDRAPQSIGLRFAQRRGQQRACLGAQSAHPAARCGCREVGWSSAGGELKAEQWCTGAFGRLLLCGRCWPATAGEKLSGLRDSREVRL